MSHTPGLWTTETGPYGKMYVCDIRPGKYIIASVGVEWPSAEVKANARLIAAAPELLEACKAYVNAGTDKEDWAAMQLAVKAIAKAEGKND